MDSLKRPLRKLDKLQQKYTPVAFTAAVLKKYSDDEGGKMAALITYYGFLSLFPLLLVVTSAVHFLLWGQEELQARVVEGINGYFPIIGEQLQASITGFNRSGLALIIGILLTVYGARGGAATVRYAMHQVWDVPKKMRPGFPLSILHSLLIILVGGGGLLLASIISGYAVIAPEIHVFRALPFLISFVILAAAFYLVFNISVNSREPARKDLLVSAVVAAAGVQALQIAGGYLVAQQLNNLSTLYGTFAIVLGLLFWLYLQAQVFIIAAYAGAVHARKLWPRKFID